MVFARLCAGDLMAATRYGMMMMLRRAHTLTFAADFNRKIDYPRPGIF
jgi:hypothetical protein